MAAHLSMTLKDAKNQKATAKWTVSSWANAIGAFSTPLIQAVGTLSSATVTSVRASIRKARAGAIEPNDSYPTIEDKLQLILNTSSGNKVRAMIPAPKSNIFLQGTERLNVADADFDAWLTSAIALLKDRTGGAIVGLVSGERGRLRTRS